MSASSVKRTLDISKSPGRFRQLADGQFHDTISETEPTARHYALSSLLTATQATLGDGLFSDYIIQHYFHFGA